MSNKKAQFSAFSKLKNPIYLIIFIFLCVYTVSIIFPLVWGFMTSFKERTDFAEHSIFALPHFDYWDLNKGNPNYVNYDHPLGNYVKMIADCKIRAFAVWYKGFVNQVRVANPPKNLTIIDFAWNTVLYTIVASILRTLGPMIVGYLCARYKNKFSSLVYAFVIFTMVTPIIGAASTTLALVRGLGIFDSWLDVFIRSFGFANMYFLIFYAFFDGASGSYAEAAEIDGASQFRVMVTIYFPLAMTMFGTVLLMQFVDAWNDYNTALMYLPTHLTLAYAVYYYTQPGNTPFNSPPFIIATSMILAIPTLLLFLIFKNKLMGNISLGGVKE